MSALCVFSFVKTSLADASCYFTMAIKVDFPTVTFCPSDGVASMCSSLKDVPRSTSVGTFSTTLNSTLVSKSPISICSVMFPWVLSWSLDADKSNGCTS